MTRIERSPLPTGCLLSRYANGVNYVDCYTARTPTAVTHEQFIRAFYSTRLFKLERFVLRWLADKPSSDADVVRLATGETNTFAAWRVEGRTSDEILLCDFLGNTRSWLKTERFADGTHLSFGSAVVARARDGEGRPVLGARFRALLGFHQRYSVALLRAAIRNLESSY